MRFPRRDHESYIGGYDPEHEMPDPDRDPRSRWQSDAYRNDPRRYEDRYGRYEPYDRPAYDYYGRPDYNYPRRDYYDSYYDRERSFDRGPSYDNREFSHDDLRDYERNRGRGRMIDSDFDRAYDIGPHATADRGTAYDSPRDYGRTFDRGWDRRPDGERIGSEYGWSRGNRAREWDHDRAFDERGLRRRW